MMRALQGLVFVWLSLVSVRAQATLVTSTYCFTYATAFTDAAVGDLLTGGHTTARGARVQFIQETGYTLVNDVYISDDTGCVTLDGSPGRAKLDNGMTYTIKVLREAYVNGANILVKTGAGGSYTSVPTTGFHPQGGRTYSYSNGDYWTRLSSTDSVHIMAVAQWALRDASSQVSMVGETFEFRTAGCDGTGSDSCFQQSTEILWIASPDRKFTTAYILGLAVAAFSNDHDGVSKNSAADIDDCIDGEDQSGVIMNTKEYQSAAIYYGFGAFYAAVTFNNDGTDADCEYSVEVDVDWNADSDGAIDTDEDQIFSCSGSPAPNQSPPIGAEAYAEEKCFATGELNNRSVQYDWLRFLWDFHTDGTHGGYSSSYIFDLFGDADPDTWIASGDLGSFSTDYPGERLYTAEGGGPFGDYNDLLNVHGAQH